MAALRNAKHERFAQELAKGRTQEEAYREAGYRGDRTTASRLATKDNIQARVLEISEHVALRVEVSLASITDDLARIAATAEAMKDSAGLSVARAAKMDIAKLHGLVIDKARVESHNRTALISDKPMTEDEWEAQVASFT
jgi:phage terminase small subunit